MPAVPHVPVRDSNLTELQLGELICRSYDGGSFMKHVADLAYGCHRSWFAAEHFERNQRQQVSRTGECGDGCDSENLVPRLSGQIICRLTNRPCPKQQLVSIVARIGIVNGSRAAANQPTVVGSSGTQTNGPQSPTLSGSSTTGE